MNNNIALTAGSLFAVVLLIMAAQFYRYAQSEVAPLSAEQLASYGAVLYPQARPLMQIAMTTDSGQRFDYSAFNGQWSLLHFGFTHCADSCPVNMAVINQTQQRLKDGGLGDIGKFLVSLDPQRDTAQVLAAYVDSFGGDWTGLRAEVPDLTHFAQSLNTVFIQHHEEDQTGHGYQVDHSNNLVILNPEGQLAGLFRPPHRAEAMAAVLGNLMQTRP